MRAIALGLAAAATILACAGPQRSGWAERQHKLDKMDARLAEIRTWRHERGIRADMPHAEVVQWIPLTLQKAENVCAANHPVPKTCSEICILADDICDNAETICSIADELGRDDKEGQDRCASAKASCHDAKQRCCACSAAPEPTP